MAQAAMARSGFPQVMPVRHSRVQAAAATRPVKNGRWKSPRTGSAGENTTLGVPWLVCNLRRVASVEEIQLPRAVRRPHRAKCFARLDA